MSYPTCDHLKEDGVYCDSPALRGQKFCYFRFNVRARRLQIARGRLRGQACRLQLPVLDDIHAVQAALMQVLDALADDRMDHKRAGLMLYALQQASSNLNSTPEWQGRRPQIELDQPLRAIECPSLEEQYDLPADINLEVPPEGALQEAKQNAALPHSERKKKPRRRLARVRESSSIIRRAFHRDDDPDDEWNEPRPVGSSIPRGGLQLPSFGNCGESSAAAPQERGIASVPSPWVDGGAPDAISANEGVV